MQNSSQAINTPAAQLMAHMQQQIDTAAGDARVADGSLSVLFREANEKGINIRPPYTPQCISDRQ